MGYRLYLGVMPKRKYNKIKSLTKQQLYDFYDLKSDFDDEEPYMGVYDFGKRLYEFGKYCDFDPPRKTMKSFFKKKDLKEKYNEYDFYVVTKEFLAFIIEYYTNKVKAYYADMLNPFFDETKNSCINSDFLNSIKIDYHTNNDKHKFDFTKITDDEQTALFKIIEHVRSFAREWGVYSIFKTLPYDLKNGNEITTSWKFEYEIFELVRIYKTFDWKRNVMIYYGY